MACCRPTRSIWLPITRITSGLASRVSSTAALPAQQGVAGSGGRAVAETSCAPPVLLDLLGWLRAVAAGALRGRRPRDRRLVGRFAEVTAQEVALHQPREAEGHHRGRLQPEQPGARSRRLRRPWGRWRWMTRPAAPCAICPRWPSTILWAPEHSIGRSCRFRCGPRLGFTVLPVLVGATAPAVGDLLAAVLTGPQLPPRWHMPLPRRRLSTCPPSRHDGAGAQWTGADVAGDGPGAPGSAGGWGSSSV